MSFAVSRIDHAVYWVRDVQQSKDFYTRVLGLQEVVDERGACLLRAPSSDQHHDLGLFQADPQAARAPRGNRRLVPHRMESGAHRRFKPPPCTACSRRKRSPALPATVPTKSVYGVDPDGNELELLSPFRAPTGVRGNTAARSNHWTSRLNLLATAATLEIVIMQMNTTEELIADIRAGKMVILMDDEDRENEGDIIMAAEHCGAEHINFMAKYARGLICMPMSRERCERLGLPLMVQKNASGFGTKFTLSIEAATGVTTGISAATARALCKSPPPKMRKRVTSCSLAIFSR
jgi:catechol 2,3-dioxygenase-like lactoylglutathione lyase family enzyme